MVGLLSKLKLKKKAAAITAMIALAVATLGVTAFTAFGAAGTTPPHTKNLTDNHDGTYTISLDVVGESERKPNPVNVIVILDNSGSMDTRTGGYGSQTRMAAAQNAVNNLARSLYAYNTTEFPDLVQMALVGFSTTGSVVQGPTNSYNTFSGAVNRLDADGGTNWEDALQDAAGINFNDDDPTYVIFVSDGNPTFRNTRGNYNPMDNYYYNTWGVYGNGSDSQTVAGIAAATTIARCYEHAVDDAESLATSVGADHFYTIGAYGNVDRMRSLTTDAGAPAGNYFSAANTTDLQNALAAILAQIEKAGIGSVEIEDGTTNQVATSSGVAELLEVDTSSFQYYKDGVEWADAPEAEFVNGAVEWDLSSVGVLDDGVKYTVTFDCYPSQYTYDTIARLKNGDLQYSKLDPEVQKYIVDNGNGTYSLRTNTTATLDWDDTRTDDDEKAVTYDNPDPVRTDSSTLPVNKEWEGGTPDVDELDITVMMDGTTEFHTATISDDNGWATSSFISPGIIKNGKVLSGAEGHDFNFAELGDEQYHWELDSPTVHPMLINGTLTMLVKVDGTHPAPSGATTYEFNNATYYVDNAAAGLTATNHRRSNLNLTKVVTGEDAPADATFPFTLTVNNSKAPATEPTDDPDHNSDYWVWFSIYDTKAGATVTDATVSGSGVVGPSANGYYYAPSGTAISVQMKANWNLRFTNLPSGTTYTFAEGTLADGFAFNKAELTQGTDTTFSAGQTSTGTIQNTKTSYTVTYTNDYALTNLEITKVWADNHDQDGKRLSADELKAKLKLSPSVEGAEPTVVDNDDDTYTITYTGLPRFNNGEEVEYTVTESAIDGYTTTGSPAKDHGTITNTHTPETTEVTVVKVWDDSDDIGKIRPGSINAQLTADGTASGDPVALNADNEWTYTWENLPKYKDGKAIEYSADETAVPAGYKKTGPVKTETDTGVTFTVTNTYNPKPVSVDPPVQKVITGKDDLYNKGDFTFKIEAVTEGAPMPENTSITNSADYEFEGKTGFYEFGEITFTKPGTYTYKVTESGDVDGVTNDPAAETGKELTFTVTDDGTGKLVVDPTTDQVQLSFTNVYDADGEASIVVSKEIAGAAWPAGKTLTLTIAGANGAPMPDNTTATLDAAGSVTFGPIKYGLSDKDKEYTYTITEDSFGAGWSGAPASVKATVKVSDNGDGTLKADVTYDPTDAKFTNTYKATGNATLEVEKKLEGAAWPEGKTLTMTLAGQDGAPMPAEGGETVKLTAAGKATFGDITYTEADINKTYTYTISEDGFGNGWTGSGDVTATVKVTDNGDGTLKTEVTYSPENDTITNTYKAAGEIELFAGKKLEVESGNNAPDVTGKYTLTLEAQDGAPMPEGATDGKVEIKNADGDGTMTTFGKIAFTEADAGKTYTYKVTETGTVDGVVNGTAEYTVTVEVTDNGNGTLTATATPDAETLFTNTYEVEPTTASFPVKKVVSVPEGQTGPAEWSYDIAVAANDGAPEVETMTGTVDQDSDTANFGPFTFDAPGTYTYTVTETGTVAGITNDADATTGKIVTITVVDNGDGTMTATADSTEENPVTFTNTYSVEPTTAEFPVKKIMSVPEGVDGPSKWSYTIGVAAGEGAPEAEAMTGTVDQDNDTATFGPFEFTAPGEYTYTVTETGTVAGVTNDTAASTGKTVTVTVVDNGDGTMTATADSTEENPVSFTNTYNVDPATVVIPATKVLEIPEGLDGPENASWTVSIAAASDGAPMPETTEYTVAPGQTVSFGDISFAKPGDYQYTVTESGTVPGVTNGQENYTVKVSVVDNGDGTLTATADYNEENPVTFTNKYNAEPTKAALEVMKDLTGTPLTAGAFEFELTFGDEVIQTKTNDANGIVNFDEITYEKPGTYTYTISEKNGGKGGYSYDTNTVTATVTVTDNREGGLVADVTYSGDTTFKNTYEASGDVDLSAAKKLTGRTLEADQFSFELLDADGNVIETVTNNASGAVQFSTLNYDQTIFDDQATDEAAADDQATGDDAVTGLEDVAATDETATDEAAATDEGAAEETDAEAAATDEAAEGEAVEGEAVEGEAAAEETDAKAADAAEAEVVETAAEAEAEPRTKTFNYTIREVAGDAAGYIYDTHEIGVTVTVTDNDDGTLTAVPEYSGETTFVNTYEASGEAQFNGTKTVEGTELAEGQFTFQLKDEKGAVLSEATNDADGNFSFDVINYAQNAEQTDADTGTFKYTIVEVNDGQTGYTYDSHVCDVTVTVTDNGDGTLGHRGRVLRRRSRCVRESVPAAGYQHQPVRHQGARGPRP